MNLKLEKLQEIYGNSILKELKDNKEDLLDNLEYLKNRGYDNVIELFELYPYSFLQDPTLFQEKVDELIKKLGVEYVEKIEENTGLWECIENE